MAYAHMIHFDTLKYAETLKAAGIPEKQAKVFAEVQQESLSQCIDTALATKADLLEVKAVLKAELTREINSVKVDLEKLRSEVHLLKWMMGFLLAGVATLILKAFF